MSKKSIELTRGHVTQYNGKDYVIPHPFGDKLQIRYGDFGEEKQEMFDVEEKEKIHAFILEVTKEQIEFPYDELLKYASEMPIEVFENYYESEEDETDRKNYQEFFHVLIQEKDLNHAVYLQSRMDTSPREICQYWMQKEVKKIKK